MAGEVLILLVVTLGFVAFGPTLAIIALARGERLRKRVKDLEATLKTLDTAATAPPPRPVVAPPVVSVPPPTVVSPPPPPVPRPAATPREMPPPPPSVRVTRPPAPPAPRRDFATNLGPKLLVGTGALAFVVFLGLFVKYAWENNWIGPTGRVLFGALMGVGLMAGGVRLLGREYRPLGQGLAGAGLASLYVSAFGAHGFYQLISWQGAGVLMAAITASAVLLAMKLDARLLAALAWVGGYLTPVLLAPREDLALVLYAYLAFLDLGALLLDRRKPWLETAPLAMLGTLLLYVGWYAQFFNSERFGVAAFGIVLFTGLFSVGMARKERGPALAVVLAFATIGVSVLAAGADRPVWLLLMSLALAVVALGLASSLGSLFAVIGSVAFVLPLLAWSLAHFRPEAFGLAAAWVLLGLLLFAFWDREGFPEALRGVVLVVGGLFSMGMAAEADKPVALMLFLLAQAGVAILVRRSWEWAEVVGVVAAFVSALAWFDAFYKPGEPGKALALALPVVGVYLCSLVVRNLVLNLALARADLVTHFINATFAWTLLYRVLYSTDPAKLGVASVALAALYLALGLAALRKELADASNIRVCLGLAAVFLTLAIPVQLGLHGITLAWAVEGALLLWLGTRFESWRARVGAYGILALAVLRLFARHFPLHRFEPFAPVANRAFGTWLFVIACLGVGLFFVSRAGLARERPDSILVPATAVSGLALLFLLVTWETRDTFAGAAREALAVGDRLAAQQASFQGGLAVSVLWTIFATGLLAAGLGIRNRPLFYAAYGLFALTSVKVVFVDLATLQALYRMLSFLALALLLLAGAYLNLRFRARLLPREADT